MNYIDQIMPKFLCEIGIYFHAKPKEKSIFKLQNFCKTIKDYDFNYEKVIEYVEFCYKKLKKIKNIGKKSSVDYFVGIITNEEILAEFLDIMKNKKQISEMICHTESDNLLMYRGDEFIKAAYKDDIEIFISETSSIMLLIKDCSNIVPKLYTLKEYNEKYPDKQITPKSVKNFNHFIRG